MLHVAVGCCIKGMTQSSVQSCILPILKHSAHVISIGITSCSLTPSSYLCVAFSACPSKHPSTTTLWTIDIFLQCNPQSVWWCNCLVRPCCNVHSIVHCCRANGFLSCPSCGAGAGIHLQYTPQGNQICTQEWSSAFCPYATALQLPALGLQ